MKNKQKNKQFILKIVLLSLLGSGSAYSLIHSELGNQNGWLDQETRVIGAKAPQIDKKVLRLGLKAYLSAQKRGLDQKGMLTIIDYSKPSSEKRLWVFDVKRNKLLLNTVVAHGNRSGDVLATSFSNKSESHKSSFGVFLTDIKPYVGSHGQALRIHGLEKGINDNAYKRNIVFHGSHYVGEDIARKQGHVGRSWGCPAVDQKLIKPLIKAIKDETLVFAYYPDKNWLNSSRFLVG